MTTEVIQNETSAKIAALNDEHRRSMQGCTVTKGIVAMGSAANEVFVGVRDYAAFTEDNDPYGEHDFGSLVVAGDEGFEPPNAGTRTQCLTTWRIPKTFSIVPFLPG